MTDMDCRQGARRSTDGFLSEKNEAKSFRGRLVSVSLHPFLRNFLFLLLFCCIVSFFLLSVGVPDQPSRCLPSLSWPSVSPVCLSPSASSSLFQLISPQFKQFCWHAEVALKCQHRYVTAANMTTTKRGECICYKSRKKWVRNIMKG